MSSSYEDITRAMLWPNAVAAASLIPHGGQGTVCESPRGCTDSLDFLQFAADGNLAKGRRAGRRLSVLALCPALCAFKRARH